MSFHNNDEYIIQLDDMNSIIEGQDKDLNSLHSSLIKLGSTATEINKEVVDQNVLLEVLIIQAESTDSELKKSSKIAKDLIRIKNSKYRLILVGIFITIIVIILALIFHSLQ